MAMMRSVISFAEGGIVAGGLIVFLYAPSARAVAPNDPPVTAKEVQREVEKVLAGRKAEPEALRALEAQARQQLSDRRLVLRYLRANKFAASDQDIDLEIDRLRKQLARQNVKLADHLKQFDTTEAELRQTLAWQLSWRHYLAERLTDDALQKYFAGHARDFDGTQIKAAHILLKLPEGADRAAIEAAIAKGKTIQREIAAGQLTFAAAAARYSQAPTAGKGGEIGFISRGEPMPEAFSAAAFALEPGQ